MKRVGTRYRLTWEKMSERRHQGTPLFFLHAVKELNMAISASLLLPSQAGGLSNLPLVLELLQEAALYIFSSLFPLLKSLSFLKKSKKIHACLFM